MARTPGHEPNRVLRIVLDYLLIFVGASLYAFAAAAFIRPINAPLGGVSGIAQIISELTPLPMGIMIIAMNIPLFAVSWKGMGRRFIIQTGLSMGWSSVLIDLLSGKIPQLTDNPLLASLYGGVIMGAGLGLVFSRGATTGGTDIISKLIHKKHEHLAMGRVNMVCNAVVIAVASVIFQSIESALYAIVIQYVSATVIDAILHGMDNANCALIVTTDADGMAKAINEKLRRGVTGLYGEGMYTKAQHVVLMVAVRNHELGGLKRLVYQYDSGAFIIMLNASEVTGKGFKSIT
ncbi:membrane protein [Clostridia bacterium]|nr:membrane protein [Clostridia bacterium]